MDAIEKINREMQKEPDDLYTEIVGHYVIDRCVDPACERAAAEDDKTLDGAMRAIRQAAEKKKKGNVAVLTPQEVFQAVDTYFGFALDAAAHAAAQMHVINVVMTAGAAYAPEHVQAQSKVLRLEDFL